MSEMILRQKQNCSYLYRLVHTEVVLVFFVTAHI